MKLFRENVQWRVQDFKSIEKAEISLEEGVINLLAGMNSSGKSSLLQSLLLVAQNAKSQGNLLLNGPLVRLGTADEITREGQETIKLSVGFPLAGEKYWAKYEFQGAPDAEDEIRVKSLTIFRVGDADSPEHHAQPIVELVSTPSKTSNKDIQSIHNHSIFDESVVLRIKQFEGTEPKDPRAYVEFLGLSPVTLHKFPKPGENSKDLRGRLLTLLAGSPDPNADAKGEPRIRDVELLVWMRLSELERSDLKSYGLDPSTMEGFPRRRLGSRPRHIFAQKDLKKISQIVADRTDFEWYVVDLRADLDRRDRFPIFARHALADSVWELEHQHTVKFLRRVSEVVAGVSNSVNYLGPLRDEPRVLWANFSSDLSGLPVGIKGEYTAQLLRESHRKVVHRTFEGKKVEQTISGAVSYWLDVLNLATSVKARSRGGLGVSMQVEIGASERSLTSVGVGVSQALPVIIAVLTARKGSIVMLEQPELHLHPATQSGLADFLLKARPDLTLMVETHSEALITRIRRRKAESDLTVDRVRILFVEKDEGCSKFEELSLTKWGDLKWWPKGFLDDGSDLRALMEAKFKMMEAPDAGA